MYIQTTVINREITNESMESFRDGVRSLAFVFLWAHDSDPFKDPMDPLYEHEECFVDKIYNLDFDKDISFELTSDHCGFSVYKLEDYARCYAWSNKDCTFDGVVEWVC